MKICVVGLGYIGLPTAALLAGSGYEVVGVDVNPTVVETINDGKIHIVEPDLDSFVHRAVSRGALHASLSAEPADVFMLCVPTPFHPLKPGSDTPEPNVDYVVSAAKAVAPFVRPGNSVILESTSPVGTTEIVAKTLTEAGCDLSEVAIAYCPERVLPGKIMVELVENDRIVGGINPAATAKVKKFYESFVRGEVFGTDCRTAEMAKLVENSYRDVNIAFANELSMLCDEAGINVWELIQLANRHPRVKILSPGAGVGGHCIAVDPWFIVAQSPKTAKIIRAARQINDRKQVWVVEKVEQAIADFSAKHGRTPVVACLGLAFKPDIDDLRESPALEIAHDLVKAGHHVLSVEPNIDSHPSIKLTPLAEALASADIVAVLVKHKQFRSIDLTGKIVIDACGLNA